MQHRHDVVEPAEVVHALLGFEQSPREDAYGRGGHPCTLHELDVLAPGFARPLLGVVVAAEPETVSDEGGAAHVVSSGGSRWSGAGGGRRPSGPSQTRVGGQIASAPVSYTHLRAHETDSYLVCRLLL